MLEQQGRAAFQAAFVIHQETCAALGATPNDTDAAKAHAVA